MLERAELIRLKQEAAEQLQAVDVSAYHLERIDERINMYARGVIGSTDDHNLYELLSLLRFFRFMDTYLFKEIEVERFILFYESLKFSGTKGRTRYRLTPIQVFQFASMLGFYKTEEKRLCREALLFVPRKYSKTTSVASLAINDLLFGDANAQAYVAANSYVQASICFDEIRNIMKALDPKLRHFKINREKIFNNRPSRTSSVCCLSSKPDNMDGKNASLIILDEYSQARSAELKNALTSSMGARLNPMTIVITTASDKLDCPFRDMLESYKAVLRGEVENDSIFAHIFEPDVDDAEDDPRTWRKVQPHLGVTVQADYYENEYRRALMTAEDMKTFRTKLLNLFVQSSTAAWFKSEEIEAMEEHIDIEQVKGRPATMCAVDLSVCDDFSAVSYTIYSNTLRKFHVHTDYYFPEGALSEHPNRELYKKWVEAGHLRLCPGPVIDYRMIVGDILERNKYLGILAIGYDPYRSLEFVNMMAASTSGARETLQPIKQTYGTFTSPVESFELAARTGKVSFNDNPINRYCFGNAVMDVDRNENRKPIKRSENEKIDGAITAIMTFYLFNNIER